MEVMIYTFAGSFAENSPSTYLSDDAFTSVEQAKLAVEHMVTDAMSDSLDAEEMEAHPGFWSHVGGRDSNYFIYRNSTDNYEFEVRGYKIK